MRRERTYRYSVRCILCFVAAVLTAACSGFGFDGPSPEDEMKEYPVYLTASQDNMTRISAEDNSLKWETADKIQLTAVTDGIHVSDTIGTSVLELFSIDESDPSIASFTGFVTLRSKPKACYFTHPVGEAMAVDAVAGTVRANYTLQDGSHKPFLFARTAYDIDGMALDLKHLGAVLELDIRTPGVTKVSFVGNGLESLSPVVINPDDDAITLPTEAVTQITVDVQENGKTYLFVPPVNLEKGFTLICSNDDGSSYFLKSYSDGSTGGYDFSAKRGVRIPISISGDFVQAAITLTDVGYEHSKNEQNLLTGTSVSFKISKSGAPDKLIDGWGATLVNKNGDIVRSIYSTEAMSDNVVTMNLQDNRILLPAGEYTFTPYYVMFGTRHTLDTQVKVIKVDDPGVNVTINGSTSYDKYKAGDVSGANSHANTLIAGLSVSTNLAKDIIASYTASMTDLGIGDFTPKVENSQTVAWYGDKSVTKYQSYVMNAELVVGDLTFNASRTFHITGLPYRINFEDGNNPSWVYLGNAEYSDKRVFFKSAALSEKHSAVRSPNFYLPEGINVLPYADASIKGNIYTRQLYVSPCSNNESSIIKGTPEIPIHNSGFGAKGLQKSSDVITLTAEKPALMFSATTPLSYGIALYKVEILYN